MPRLSTAAITAIVAGVVVLGAAGATLALAMTPSDPQVSIAPIELAPQGSPAPSATPTATPSPDPSSPIPVQPSQPHDLGDDHGGDSGGDDNSGHGGGDDDNSGHGNSDDD